MTSPKTKVQAYLRRANLTAIEHIINMSLHVNSPEEVVSFLRAYAEFIVEDFGLE